MPLTPLAAMVRRFSNLAIGPVAAPVEQASGSGVQLEGGAISPAAGSKPAWPPKKAAAAKIGRPPRQSSVFSGYAIYLTNAGKVVKVCATGIRMPSTPIRAPAGVSNSMVPRMFAAAGYLSTASVNARCPFAAKGIVSVAICAPVSSRTDTIPLAANGHLAFTLAVDKYPAAANIRGTIEFDTPAGARIGVLGIRIPVAHTFTTLPALVR